MDSAKIFKNGRSQAVRLPKKYRFKEKDVYVRKIDDLVLLIPKNTIWKVFESGLDYFTDDFLLDRDQPEAQKRKGL